MHSHARLSVELMQRSLQGTYRPCIRRPHDSRQTTQSCTLFKEEEVCQQSLRERTSNVSTRQITYRILSRQRRPCKRATLQIGKRVPLRRSPAQDRAISVSSSALKSRDLLATPSSYSDACRWASPQLFPLCNDAKQHIQRSTSPS